MGKWSYLREVRLTQNKRKVRKERKKAFGKNLFVCFAYFVVFVFFFLKIRAFVKIKALMSGRRGCQTWSIRNLSASGIKGLFGTFCTFRHQTGNVQNLVRFLAAGFSEEFFIKRLDGRVLMRFTHPGVPIDLVKTV